MDEKDGKHELSISCHCVLKSLVHVVRGRVLLHVSFSGLCPMVRHYGDQFTRERVKLFQGTFNLSLKSIDGKDHYFDGLLLPFLRVVILT